MKFSLVDRVIALESGQSIRTIKNLSLAEEYLQDHFPGFPVLPGVMMVEALVQSSAWLLREQADFAYSMTLLKQARAVKFNSFVKPGRTLHVESQIQKTDGQDVTLKATGHLNAFADAGGESAVSAKLTLRQFNIVDRRPQQAANDERLQDLLRTEFDTLWTPEHAAG